ncbi:MAG: hemolysin III family protein [Treponema sp.]|jgi:hemolysin III|nr:hemolysin III family protein [Treponema sp.]
MNTQETNTRRPQSLGEEIANSILHGLGAAFAVAGLTLLVLRARGWLGGKGGGALELVSLTIFAASMILMFLVSTLYHAIQHEGAKRVFRILDHSAIYLLIAGTYTPFSLLCLRGALGWTYFGVEWALAAAGISLYAAGIKFMKKIELAVYILMGWAVVAGGYKLYHTIPRLSFAFLIAGGAAYTLGTFWYSRPKLRSAHVIWHFFVLAGAAFHWFSAWQLA